MDKRMQEERKNQILYSRIRQDLQNLIKDREESATAKKTTSATERTNAFFPLKSTKKVSTKFPTSLKKQTNSTSTIKTNQAITTRTNSGKDINLDFTNIGTAERGNYEIDLSFRKAKMDLEKDYMFLQSVGEKFSALDLKSMRGHIRDAAKIALAEGDSRNPLYRELHKIVDKNFGHDNVSEMTNNAIVAMRQYPVGLSNIPELQELCNSMTELKVTFKDPERK